MHRETRVVATLEQQIRDAETKLFDVYGAALPSDAAAEKIVTSLFANS